MMLMHPRMLVYRELNAAINNLRDIRVSQVVRRGDDVDIAFDAARPFAMRLHNVIALHDRGVCHAPLVSGIAFVPVSRYGRSAAARAGVDAEKYVEIWLDDVVERNRVFHRLAAVAFHAELV
ncbi:MAG TPA: hypothetical protein VMU84_03105 [Thermoanaerobaculia bacterium]|nr:hypothetical protein [Thermoanaerobaculia bacterium]